MILALYLTHAGPGFLALVRAVNLARSAKVTLDGVQPEKNGLTRVFGVCVLNRVRIS